jgi:hypothetical protein
MNTEFETVNGSNEENIQTGVHSNDDDCHNGELDIQFECKQEVHSEGEDEEKCAVKQQMTENYAGVAVKEESCDPKGTTEDERYVLLVEMQLKLVILASSIKSPTIPEFREVLYTSPPLWLGWVRPNLVSIA